MDNPQDNPSPAPAAPIPDPARRWQLVTILAGSVLFICWFLPVNEDDPDRSSTIMAFKQYLANFFEQYTLLEYAYGFVAGAGVHWAGLLIAVSAASRLFKNQLSDRMACWAIIVMMTPASVLVLCELAIVISRVLPLYPSYFSPWPVPVVSTAFILSLFHLVHSRGKFPFTIYVGWLSAFTVFCWFSFWGVQEVLSGRYSTGLRWAASTVLMFSVTAEAAIIGNNSWIDAFSQYVFSEPNNAKDKSICEQCGYDLRGLTTPRCPECGTPFDESELKT